MCDQRQRRACFPRARRATHAVHVRVDIRRRIVRHDVLDVVDVHPTSDRVRTDQPETQHVSGFI